MRSWGRHLILNARKCNSIRITNQRTIELFAQDMVKKIDMTPFGKPQVLYFGEGNKAGYTLIQLIETSNITGHFCDDTGDAYLDVFSCKYFDENVAKAVVQEWFQPEWMDTKVVERDAKVLMH
jgi:S-adenosylmethionine/arginine decarboxylase-like enzyme